MSHAPPTIDAMQSSDYDAVAALWARSEGLGKVETSAEFQTFLDRNPDFSPVARAHDGRIVGAMFSGHDGRRGYLSHLAVDPTHRRVGIAREMIEWALAKLNTVPVQRVSVHVYTHNVNAVEFWRQVCCWDKPWRYRDDLCVLAYDLPIENPPS